MVGLFTVGRLLPSVISTVVLCPGAWFAEALLSIVPDAATAALIGNGDDGPAVFVSVSVVLAFAFWWVSAFSLLMLRSSWLRRRPLL
jgi:hypothetical protein